MSKHTTLLVIEVAEVDADSILFNDLHGNAQSVTDSGASYQIISAEMLEDYLEEEK